MINKKISEIKGIGPVREKQFARLGIETTLDMLYFFPRRLEDRTQIKSVFEAVDGETCCVKVIARRGVSVRRIRPGFTVYEIKCVDDSGSITAVWYNNPYIKSAIVQGKEYVLYGKITAGYGKKQIITPVFESADNLKQLGKIAPIYPLSGTLTQKNVFDTVKACIEAVLPSLSDPIPIYIRHSYNLPEIGFSMQNIHFPKDFESYEIARSRFVFEELFILQTAIRLSKTKRENAKTHPIKNASLAEFEALLPFGLTGAQKRVIDEIYADIKKAKPMNRLVQGDVSSGKTVVAAAALYAAVQNGFQGALMVPTEILAKQHMETFTSLFPALNVLLLSGSLTAKQKREALEKIHLGEADIVIGTHAIIEDSVTFKNLGLIVTDEQHRFGVKQRGALIQKGYSPHVLVMTATPIPRTLTLVLYGDLDISVLDELPPGRKPVETFAVGSALHDRAYTFVKKEIEKGNKAFVVCPLVDENEDLDLVSVTKFTDILKEKYFSPDEVAFIHGKMKAKEKDAVMDSFINGNINVLVSTTVIEVGVNVPAANFMIVENAERFGLSQLHQLRGRVGRGNQKAYCILFSDSKSEITRERLRVMTKTNDGFIIAEKDLQLRGPGEFFGIRQHGLPELKVANLFEDTQILKKAGVAAQNLLDSDPELKKLEHQNLATAIHRLFTEKMYE